MQRARLVFVGVATHDTIAAVDHFPDPDDRVVATELVHAGGGPAATAAVAAARLGHHVAFVGTVGDDPEGRSILAGLAAEDVDTDGVTVVPGARSAASVVLVDEHRSTRAIINRPPPPIEVSMEARDLLASAHWVHVDQAGWAPIHGWWSSRPDRPRLSVDAGNPIDGLVLAGVDLYAPTVSALRRRFGPLDRFELLDRAVADGAQLVVATDGAAGAVARGVEQPAVHVPAVEGAVRSTLGAGDVFHGALLAALHRGFDVPTAMRYASVTAFRSCEGLDGRSAIPSHDEVMAGLAVTDRSADRGDDR